MIYINNIPSLRNPDSDDDLLIDDRKEIIELINGTAIQYGGIFFGGFKLTCTFSENNFRQILNFWIANSTVSYTDKAGFTFYGLTMKFYKIRRINHFHKYVRAEFELLKEQRTPLTISDFGF